MRLFGYFLIFQFNELPVVGFVDHLDFLFRWKENNNNNNIDHLVFFKKNTGCQLKNCPKCNCITNIRNPKKLFRYYRYLITTILILFLDHKYIYQYSQKRNYYHPNIKTSFDQKIGRQPINHHHRHQWLSCYRWLYHQTTKKSKNQNVQNQKIKILSGYYLPNGSIIQAFACGQKKLSKSIISQFCQSNPIQSIDWLLACLHTDIGSNQNQNKKHQW